MNPLTLVKRTQQINEQEAKLGISEQASWHAKYNDSAYVFVGGVPFDLTEGDLVAVFAQYGEIVDVNLVRDKATGKSKGFAFVAYEDQRSTNLAVDNLNGAQVLGRTIRVDHCSKYKKKEEEDEETARQKREERGVCRAFQKGECTRGDSCKFSHDEKRAANTGWGAEEDRPKWANDKFDSTQRNGHSRQTNRIMKDDRLGNNDMRGSKGKDDGLGRDGHQKGSEWKSRDQGSRDFEKRSEKEWKSRDQGSRDFEKRSEKDRGRNYKGEMDRSHADRKSRRPDDEQMPREDRDQRDIEKRSEKDKGRNYKEEMDRSHAGRKSRQPDDEHMSREDRDKRGEKRVRSESLRREDQERMRRPGYERDSSPHHQKMSDSEQREDRAKRDEKRTRFESDSYQGEERESGRSDKRSDYGRDSSPRHRRTDEDRGHRSHR